MHKHGKLIVLEGGEGAGKGTVLDKLKASMGDGEDADVIFTREPGGTPYGEKLRKSLLEYDPSAPMSNLAQLLTFAAIRANHCDLLIRPALEAGRTVISDRFSGSTYAYQIAGHRRDDLVGIFHLINDIARGIGTSSIIEPACTIYLDIAPEIGLRRVSQRGDELTIFDRDSLEFHEHVRAGYLHQAKGSSNWHIIDASQSPDDVYREVYAIVEQIHGRIHD